MQSISICSWCSLSVVSNNESNSDNLQVFLQRLILIFNSIFRVHNMHRSGILDIITKRNARRIMTVPEVEFKSVSLTQVTPILVLLATGTVAAMLLLKLESIIFRKNLRANKHKRNRGSPRFTR
jgi:hypothetical protein